MEAAIERLDLEPRRSDLRFRVARCLAASERTRPEERIEGALEHSKGRIVGADMLPEAELSTGCQHSPHLSQRGGGVGHGAEHSHDDGDVECSVACGQRLGDTGHDVDRNLRCFGSLRCGRPGCGIRLNRQQTLDLRRVVLERATVAGADLDHPSLHSREQLPAEIVMDEIGVTQLTPLEVAREARLLRTVEGRFGSHRIKSRSAGPDAEASLLSEATMSEAWLQLDTPVKERIRKVLENPQRPVTEAELRKLSEEARACTLILGAELERLEHRLAELDRDSDSSLGAIADAFRRVHDFRAHLEELDGLVSALEGRAREVRTSWMLPRGR
jgi:hypothetical protein